MAVNQCSLAEEGGEMERDGRKVRQILRLGIFFGRHCLVLGTFVLLLGGKDISLKF